MKKSVISATVLGGAVAPATYSISGTVYDANGTTAVASATVALGAASTTSGVDGTYTITGVAAGASGSMTCTLTGYSWTAITVAAMSGNLTSQNYTNAWWAAGGTSASVVAAYRGIGAATYAASLSNLANPGTHDLIDTAHVPNWNTASGWTLGNWSGTNHYFATDIQAQRSWSFSMRVASATGGGLTLFGVRDAANKSILAMPDYSSGKCNWASGTSFGAYGTSTAGIRIGVFQITGATGYIDNTLDVSSMPNNVDFTLPLQVGGYNGNGTANGFSTNKEFVAVGFCVHSIVLNDTQRGVLYTAMGNLT
jgi:hypothetical protein